MLSTEEKNFITYWEANRDKQKSWKTQLITGLPIGLIFGLPILLNLFVDWNVQIKEIKRGQLNVLLFAVGIIVTFIAIFTVRHKWDLREQHYKELLQKQRQAKEKENQNL